MKTTNSLATIATIALALVAISTQSHAADTTATVALNAPAVGSDIILKKAPNFDFGKTTITSSAATTTAFTASDSATVEDSRGTGAGWDLQVKVSDFTEGSKKLTGVKLNLDAPKPTTQGTGIAPVGTKVVLDAMATGASASTTEAVATQGMGGWDMTYSGGTLTIPAGNYTGTYVAQMEWTLVNA